MEGPARLSYRPRGCGACVAQIQRGARERPSIHLPAPPAGRAPLQNLSPGPRPWVASRARPRRPAGEEPLLSRFVPRRRGARTGGGGAAASSWRSAGRRRAEPSRPRRTRLLTRRASGDDLVRGLLQKAPGLPSHSCPRRGGDERQLAPGERLPSRGRVRSGRVGKSQGRRGAAVICGREGEPGAGAQGCAAPRRPLAAGPGQRAAPSRTRARCYGRSLPAGRAAASLSEGRAGTAGAGIA